MNILLGKHHDITSFASKDASRYVLNGVHYNHDKQRIEATDGAVCIQVPVVVDSDDSFPPVSVNGTPEDCIIPTKPFQKALSNVPKLNLPICNHMRLSVSAKAGPDQGKQVNMVTNDLDTEQNVGAKTVDGEYPDLDAVTPAETPKLAICISSQILKQIADYAERYGKMQQRNNTSVQECPVRLEFVDELSAVRFSIPLDTPLGGVVRATGVAMPMRMS